MNNVVKKSLLNLVKIMHFNKITINNCTQFFKKLSTLDFKSKVESQTFCISNNNGEEFKIIFYDNLIDIKQIILTYNTINTPLIDFIISEKMPRTHIYQVSYIINEDRDETGYIFLDIDDIKIEKPNITLAKILENKIEFDKIYEILEGILLDPDIELEKETDKSGYQRITISDRVHNRCFILIDFMAEKFIQLKELSDIRGGAKFSEILNQIDFFKMRDDEGFPISFNLKISVNTNNRLISKIYTE